MDSHSHIKPGPFPAMTRQGTLLEPASSISAHPIKWIWEGHLASGKLHIIAGPPSTGKTLIALHMAATLSNAGRWPDLSTAPLGKVLICASDHGIEETIIPRLLAAGANMSNIHIVRMTIDGLTNRPFNFHTDIERLAHSARKLDNVQLIVIDSIEQAFRQISRRRPEIHHQLRLLLDLCQDIGCALLGTTHIAPSSKQEPVEHIRSKLDYSELARIIWITGRNQTLAHIDNAYRGVLVRVKSDIGPNTDAFAYQIVTTSVQTPYGPVPVASLQWQYEAIPGNARQILDQADGLASAVQMSALRFAVEFLNHFLLTGHRTFPEIKTEAAAAGISLATLKRAKHQLNVGSYKQSGMGKASPYVWHLPHTSTFPPPDQDLSSRQQDLHLSLASDTIRPVGPVGMNSAIKPYLRSFFGPNHVPMTSGYQYSIAAEAVTLNWKGRDVPTYITRFTKQLSATAPPTSPEPPESLEPPEALGPLRSFKDSKTSTRNEVRGVATRPGFAPKPRLSDKLRSFHAGDAAGSTGSTGSTSPATSVDPHDPHDPHDPTCTVVYDNASNLAFTSERLHRVTDTVHSQHSQHGQMDSAPGKDRTSDGEIQSHNFLFEPSRAVNEPNASSTRRHTKESLDSIKNDVSVQEHETMMTVGTKRCALKIMTLGDSFTRATASQKHDYIEEVLSAMYPDDQTYASLPSQYMREAIKQRYLAKYPIGPA